MIRAQFTNVHQRQHSTLRRKLRGHEPLDLWCYSAILLHFLSYHRRSMLFMLEDLHYPFVAFLRLSVAALSLVVT